ncbi:MAG: hypothetical protein LLG02_03395 [Pelosinus sp.]|nr:hypothetical protein [Pelosinus sp.]
MKNRRIALIAIVILLAFGIIYMAITKENANDTIFSQGLMFKNEEFGITVKIPDNWLQTQEDKKKIQEVINTQDTQEITMVVISKHPVKNGSSDNAMMIWSTKDVTKYPNVSSEQCALKVKETAQKLGTVVIKGPFVEKIDGIDFFVLDVEARNGVIQKNYSAIVKGYFHNISFTYKSKEDINTWNEIIKSITIRK